MTGRDMLSVLVGYSKKYTWATWNLFPELIDFLVTLTTTPVNIQDDTELCIERFVEILYECTTQYKDLNEVRKKLFTSGTPFSASHLPIMVWNTCEEISLPG